jgi:hypothetical protein
MESNTDRVKAPCPSIQASVDGDLASMNRNRSVTLVPKYVSSTGCGAMSAGAPAGSTGVTRPAPCAAAIPSRSSDPRILLRTAGTQ